MATTSPRSAVRSRVVQSVSSSPVSINILHPTQLRGRGQGNHACTVRNSIGYKDKDEAGAGHTCPQRSVPKDYDTSMPVTEQRRNREQTWAHVDI